MSGAFQASAFQNSAFQTDDGARSQLAGQGLSGRKKYGDDLTYDEWARFTAYREQLAEMGERKAPTKIVKAVRKLATQAVERIEVTPDVWQMPELNASAQDVAAGIQMLLEHLARVDAVDEAVRQMLRDDDEAAAMILLH